MILNASSHKEAQTIEQIKHAQAPFDFVYNAEGDYYDLVVDKKIQKVVEELKALPHEVLIRYLTYWSEAIDSRKYVVESDLPQEEWYTDCCDYAASETDEERYIYMPSVWQRLLDICCKTSRIIIPTSILLPCAR